MSTSQLIFMHENISNYLWDNDIHTLKVGEKDCGNYSNLCD